MSRMSIAGLAFATSVLAPLGAEAVPLSAVAKAEARYELLLSGGTFTANAPSVAYETTAISIGDVIAGSLAIPSLNCTVPGTFCIFGGTAAATAVANDGHVRVEAGIGPFSVDLTILSPGQLIVNAQIEDEFTFVSPIPPGGAATASAIIGDFVLTGLGGGPIGFDADPGIQALLDLPIGTYTLTWSGLDTVAEAQQFASAIPTPATLALFGAALSGLALARRRRVDRLRAPAATRRILPAAALVIAAQAAPIGAVAAPITITAGAIGTIIPVTALFPATAPNGDFSIHGNALAPLAGDGIDDTTRWTFTFAGDPDLAAFHAATGPLIGASLTLSVIPRDALISTDIVRIDALSDIVTPAIQGLPVDVVSFVALDLFDFYAPDAILAALGGLATLPMTYADDAIVFQSVIELTRETESVPAPGSLVLHLAAFSTLLVLPRTPRTSSGRAGGHLSRA